MVQGSNYIIAISRLNPSPECDCYKLKLTFMTIYMNVKFGVNMGAVLFPGNNFP